MKKITKKDVEDFLIDKYMIQEGLYMINGGYAEFKVTEMKIVGDIIHVKGIVKSGVQDVGYSEKYTDHVTLDLMIKENGKLSTIGWRI